MRHIKHIVVTTFFIYLTGAISAQESFSVSVDLAYVPHLEVQVQPGYNLYRLALACGSSIQQIRESNALSDNDIRVHSILHLPLDPNRVFQDVQGLEQPIPLYFEVREGTTQYGLNRALGITKQQLKRLNDARLVQMKKGEKMLIGWIDWSIFSTSAIENQLRPTAVAPSSIEQLEISANSIYESENLLNQEKIVAIDTINRTSTLIVKEKGIAYCEKTSTNYKALIAMHKDAPLNSSISIYNPMLDRSVEAKVVGELPSEAYPEGVTVVISPSVAEALGALDRRFYVEITYQD